MILMDVFNILSRLFFLITSIVLLIIQTYVDTEQFIERKSNGVIWKKQWEESRIEIFVNQKSAEPERIKRDVYPMTSLTLEQQKDAVNIHNSFRRLRDSSDMEYMIWNDVLASMAQEWAEGCDFIHGQPDRETQPYSTLGQNLYFNTGFMNVNVSTTRWHDEIEHYSYDNNSCAKGEICGHYTQMVWSTSREIGCGYKFCPILNDSSTGEQWSNGHHFVCNYGPAGNFEDTKPYKNGPACTECINGQMWCDKITPRGLCRRECSSENSECECAASCKNCGNLNNDCSCNCAAGWSGVSCNHECRNFHKYCGKQWPARACSSKEYGQIITSFCPLLCKKCTLADDETSLCTTPATTRASSTTPTRKTTQSSVATTATTKTTEAPTTTLATTATEATTTSSSPTTKTTEASTTTLEPKTTETPVATTSTTTKTTEASTTTLAPRTTLAPLAATTTPTTTTTTETTEAPTTTLAPRTTEAPVASTTTITTTTTETSATSAATKTTLPTSAVETTTNVRSSSASSSSTPSQIGEASPTDETTKLQYITYVSSMSPSKSSSKTSASATPVVTKYSKTEGSTFSVTYSAYFTSDVTINGTTSAVPVLEATLNIYIWVAVIVVLSTCSTLAVIVGWFLCKFRSKPSESKYEVTIERKCQNVTSENSTPDDISVEFSEINNITFQEPQGINRKMFVNSYQNDTVMFEKNNQIPEWLP